MSQHLLCNKQAIPNYTARGFECETASGLVNILVLRKDNDVYGYLNNCPHVNIPLNWQPDDFISLEGTHIQCATHGALFSFENGLCVSGPCRGQSLTPISIELDPQGDIYFSSK
jgi:nitrite reductase/ring-hydroxylating ferredoxin subunit